jgi:hypothetical protein
MNVDRRHELVELSNVVSLDERRKLRRPDQTVEQPMSLQEEATVSACENGVCSVDWRPSRRPAA